MRDDSQYGTLLTEPIRGRSAAATHVGRVRSMNEDSYLAAHPIYLVADGMGGHNAGEIASAIVVDQFSDLAGQHDITPETLAENLIVAYERITRLDDSTAARSAGTTVALVGTSFDHDQATWVVMNLGDSRIYRLSNDEFEQISIDHSVVQELVDRGEITEEEARVHPYRNMVTRALGPGPNSSPDFWRLPAMLGDRFVICSDGINGELDDAVIEYCLREADDIRDVAPSLVTKAVEAGGRDNATVVALEAVADDAAEEINRYSLFDAGSV